jgi:hypothetical protein
MTVAMKPKELKMPDDWEITISKGNWCNSARVSEVEVESAKIDLIAATATKLAYEIKLNARRTEAT